MLPVFPLCIRVPSRRRKKKKEKKENSPPPPSNPRPKLHVPLGDTRIRHDHQQNRGHINPKDTFHPHPFFPRAVHFQKGNRHKGAIQSSSIGGNAEPLSVGVLLFPSVSSCKSAFILVFAAACREGGGRRPLTRAFLSRLPKQRRAAGDSCSRSESTGLHALASNAGWDDAPAHASDDFFHGNKMIFQRSFFRAVFLKSRNPLRTVLRRKWSAALTSAVLPELAGANEVHSIW